MVVLHTPRPKNRGELEFLVALEGLLDDGFHSWTELNSHTLFGSGQECDHLLASPSLGAFAIEIKSIAFSQVEKFGTQDCKIHYLDGVQEKHPLDQARDGMNSVRNFLRKQVDPGIKARHPYPFFRHCVAFPKIPLAEFTEDFGEHPQIIRQAQSFFLFAEHLSSTERLLAQLEEIYGDHRSPEQSQVDFLIKHLSIPHAVARKPPSTTADRERAKIAMRRVAAAPQTRTSGDKEETPRDRAYCGPTDPRLAIFSGAPGTGKTMELLNVAFHHAEQGRRVLFTCFNLVLGSFLEGLVAAQEISDDVATRISIIPVGRLSALAAEDSDAISALFDTVCVDEAQDLEERAFDTLRLVVKPNASWVLADGPGQELYNDGQPAPTLIEMRTTASATGSLHALQTSKRAASATLQIARSVRDIAPDRSRIPSWYSSRAIRRPDTQAALDYGGTLEEVPDPTELIDIRFWDSTTGKDLYFQSVLTEVLDRLAAEGHPRDLAILVNRTVNDAFNLATARKCLNSLGIPFLDQTRDEHKSAVLPEGHVRLVSYSSARGIEASRVLLLDLGIAFWEPKTPRDGEVSRTMLYIALTRGRLGTTVLCGPRERDKPYVEFLVASCNEYKRLMDQRP